MSRAKTWRSIDQVRRANRAAGRFFFREDTVAFFSSNVESGIIGDRFFITSEQDQDGFGRLGHVWGRQRRYSIRVIEDDASINTVGKFGHFDSAADAVAAAELLPAILSGIPDGIRAGNFDLDTLA